MRDLIFVRYKTRLIVDFDILKSNYLKLKNLASDKKILFMVKADAYGHGMISIVKFCVEYLNLKEFGVATFGEGLHLRNSLPDLEFDIYLFSDLSLDIQDCRDDLIRNRLLPVISRIQDLKNILQDEKTAFLPLSLKFNTGMNRIGIPYQQLQNVIELLKKYNRSEIYHLMSHFSCASFNVTNHPMNSKQYKLFQNIKKEIRANNIIVSRTSMANSGAIEQGFAVDQETHIRPGLMLYGPTALTKKSRNDVWEGESISRLQTQIIDIFPIKQGVEVGYDAVPCPRDGIIAIVSIGYGDGIAHYYRGARIDINGFSGEFVGKINMDMSQILLPEEADSQVKIGDLVNIWGNSKQDILDLSDQISVIPYELYCNLSSRIPRIYSLK